MKSALFLIMFCFSFPSSAQENALFYFINVDTSMGNFRAKLYKKEAPATVENFVGLATGTKQFRNVQTGKKVKDVIFYRDMIFHKVHPDLGIQTGCPWGNGKGWPGFTLKQETNELKFDRPFLLAMAKIEGDPNSVGSQFFITTKPAPHLNGKYTVIGEVYKGKSTVLKIASVPRDAMMRPLKPVKMIRISLDKEERK